MVTDKLGNHSSKSFETDSNPQPLSIARLPTEIKLQILDLLTPEDAHLEFEASITKFYGKKVRFRLWARRYRSEHHPCFAAIENFEKVIAVAEALSPCQDDLFHRIDRRIARMILSSINTTVKNYRQGQAASGWLFTVIERLRIFAYSQQGTKAIQIRQSLDFAPRRRTFRDSHHYYYEDQCCIVRHLQSFVRNMSMKSLKKFDDNYGYLLTGFVDLKCLLRSTTEIHGVTILNNS